MALRRVFVRRQQGDPPDICQPVVEFRQDTHRDGLDRQDAVFVDWLHLQQIVRQFQNAFRTRQEGPFGLQHRNLAFGIRNLAFQSQKLALPGINADFHLIEGGAEDGGQNGAD